ncbi:hypothetical protein [Ensifer sp. 22564]|uniref:hypothetical protein n=1 Tax=Ensifer sp. 22564 TaxID=3453943 RepID=UPI003F8707C3
MDPVLVLSAMRIIRAPEVAGVSAVICRSIERDAAKHGLVVTGPWIFVSDHIAKSIDDRFKIEFCLPVAASESYSGSFKLKTLSAITAASTVHNGPSTTISLIATALSSPRNRDISVNVGKSTIAG